MRNTFALVLVLALGTASLAGALGMGGPSRYSGSHSDQMVNGSLIDYGYGHVLATVYVNPGQQATVTVPDEYTKGMAPGQMTITIPANAFSDPVRFELLSGSNAYWDRRVAPNLTVVANFAYQVWDLRTGALVKKFNKPLSFSVTDPMINANSVYWATTATRPIRLINANSASQIAQDTLTHATPVSSVGWIITSPKAMSQS